jgi:predicted dehydrogenase/nucleoside-diphosphate-sugar epimerase
MRKASSLMLAETVKEHICTKPHTGPLRVALIGCGAISQQLHLPILAGHEEIKLAALVDRDVDRARDFATGYGVETVKGDANELPLDEIDAAIVATPPFHHAPCTLSLLRRGIHVLVEKPMATNYADAVAMVETAEDSGVVLSVGFFRRLMPSIRMFKALLDSRWLGRPQRFEVVSGGFYSWGAATLGNMRKDLAGGGVLIDFGSHMLDLLHYLFEGPGELLEYRDNALGGIESDCRLRLRLRHHGEDVEGSMELSRLRKLGNLFRVECEGGQLEYRLTERYRIWVTPRNLELTDTLRDETRPLCLQASWADEPESEWYDTVRCEIDDWVSAIRTGKPPQLSGTSALPTVKVIDDCYGNPQPMEEPWVWEGVRGQTPTTLNRTASSNGSPRRVLVTGATGFIGSRLAEMLTLSKGWQVRALVHNPANASRLARLPVEMVQGDLTSPQEVRRWVEGCDAIVHCAIGTSYGDRKKIFDVTVGGTSTLAKAALAAGVHRFVQISTIAVHDQTSSEILDESTPIRPPKGDDYGESKAEAERVILDAVRQGLSGVILRPVRVYGPFAQTFINRPIEAMAQRTFRLLEAADKPACMVYVDNLVEMIVRALEAPDNVVRGEAFIAADNNNMTWREFYESIAHGLGLTPPQMLDPSEKAPPQLPKHGRWWRWPTLWLSGATTVLSSPEFRGLGRRFLETDPLGTFPRWILQKSPLLERMLRKWFKTEGREIYRRVVQQSRPSLLTLGGSGFSVNIEKARRLLGFAPIVRPERALELTLEWVRHARLVPCRNGNN